MPDAIRTRCKFRVVGVEDTEYELLERIDPNNSRYADLDVPENGTYQHGKLELKYKLRPTGIYNQNVRLAASYDPASSEDVSFASATPSGELKIYVSNPAVIGTFKPGKNYYLDLVPCE
jgi:hypothetical protein